MNNRAPTVIVHYGRRIIDRQDMGNLGTLREGKMVSVDRGQFGECQQIILEMIAQVWEVDPAAVVETLEQVRREMRKRGT